MLSSQRHVDMAGVPGEGTHITVAALTCQHNFFRLPQPSCAISTLFRPYPVHGGSGAMPIYAVCSNTFCAQILELRDEQASARAIPAPEFCRSCGSRLISKC